MLIPFFRPDRIPFVVARVNGEAAVAEAAVQGAENIAHPLKDAAISNVVSAGLSAGIGVFSHVFLPVKEKT